MMLISSRKHSAPSSKMAEITIRLEDSTPSLEWDCSPKERHGANVLQAVALLNDDVHSDRLKCYSLNGARREEQLPDMISCAVTQTHIVNKHVNQIDKIKFTTSHYVGQACVAVGNDIVRFRIEPRMAKPVWRQMLRRASCVYLPERLHSRGMESGKDDSEWLLLLMWRDAFERAMKLVSVPKAYVWRNSNLRCFKGRLDVSQHLKNNIADQSRFYCTYKPLTFDNTINRTIRMVYRLLSNSALPVKSYLSIAEHDARLASFGVGNDGVTLRDIDAVSYTRHTEPYRAVMNLSKVILRGYGAGEVEGAGNGPAYFVDVAEIWENYLLSALKKHIPEYRFESPNEMGRNDWLLEGSRRVRPDFMVYDKSGRLIAIMDAKYKHVDQIGITSKDANAVSRDDLYQMATYLYRYGDPSEGIAGIFLTPFSVHGEQPLKAMAWHDRSVKHYMTVCGFPMQQIDDQYKAVDWSTAAGKEVYKQVLKEFHTLEEQFCESVKKVLDKVDDDPTLC